MVTIVTSYYDDIKIFKEYWLPLIYKHGPMEFIVVDNNSQKYKVQSVSQDAPNLKLFYLTTGKYTYDEAIIKGVEQATNNIVFITDIWSIPAYDTMVLLEDIRPGEILKPRWLDKYYGNENKPTSFAGEKDKIVDISGYNYDRLGKYIQKFNPVIKSRGTLYYVQ